MTRRDMTDRQANRIDIRVKCGQTMPFIGLEINRQVGGEGLARLPLHFLT